MEFRKYKNGQSYFRISSAEEVEELKLMGKHFKVYHIKATILPERVFIADLLAHYHEFADAINEEEYLQQLHWCQENLQAL